MEKLDQKICLDTDVVIAILNNEKRTLSLISKIENAEIFISTVTLFELLLRETNLDIIENFKDKVQILNFDELSSRKASYIFKELKKNEKLIDFKDLFIASTSIANNCLLATFNRKHFERLKEFGLNLI